MSRLIVRQARPDDNIGVVTVKRAAVRDEEAYSPAQIAAWSPGVDDLDEYEAALDDDRYLALVAEREAMVGFGILDVENGSLLALYVDPDHRDDGVGSTLLGQIETSARLQGADTLDLLAAKGAVRFYDRLGYERTGTVERRIDGETFEFVRMETELAG